MTDRDEPIMGGRRLASRRSVLMGATAVGAAGILAACGDETATPPTGPPGTAGSTPPAPTTAGGAESPGAPGDLTTAQVPTGSGVIVKDKNVVVTQPVAGDFKAFSATCTHMQCQVSEISGDTITCACHGSQYSVADGSVIRGPAARALDPRQVTVNGDSLTLG